MAENKTPVFLIENVGDKTKLQIRDHIFWLDDDEKMRIRLLIKSAHDDISYCVPMKTHGTLIFYQTGVIAVHLSLGKLTRHGSEYLLIATYMVPDMDSYRTDMFQVSEAALNTFNNVLCMKSASDDVANGEASAE